MSQIIDAVYEDGVFKPRTKPNLGDHQEVRLVIESKLSVVEKTKGTIQVPPELKENIIEIIESPNYSLLES